MAGRKRKPVSRKCKLCGVEWTSLRAHHVSEFCSKQCSFASKSRASSRNGRERSKAKSKECSCVVCGVKWCSWSQHATQRMTCGTECQLTLKSLDRSTSNLALPSFLCQYCGVSCKAIQRINGNHYKAQYCSRVCSGAAKKLLNGNTKEQRQAKARLKEIELTRECGRCKAIFQASFSHQRLCSDECKRQDAIEKSCQEYRKPRKCSVCRKEFVGEFKSGFVKLCSNECKQEQLRSKRLKAKAKRRGCRVVAKVIRAAIWNRDQGLCGLCGVPVKRDADVNDPRALEYDHIIPISKGGAHCEENLQLSCRSCNGWKSDKDLMIGGMLSQALSLSAMESMG